MILNLRIFLEVECALIFDLSSFSINNILNSIEVKPPIKNLPHLSFLTP